MKFLVTLLMSLVLASCASTRPILTICVLDGPVGLDCYDARTGSAATIPFTSADKFVCVNPDDFRTLINACGL
jgi:hypothetical protein